MKNKRGISALITTLIMVLLVLVSIGIIWAIIQNIITGGVEQISLGKLLIDLKIEDPKLVGDNVSLRVNRGIGEGDLVGIKFVVSNDSDTKVVEENSAIKELEKQTFVIESGISSIKEVSIAPIIKAEAGKEVTGNIADSFKF
ncbi:hypothetical protein CMI40_00645 [Candidatus Pacearchaeota archaeon]|jgi:flagellin-like protein|nr:hypothetical protein [Candidatus Pacearchaeota archaeon]|tara:strand:- start:2466 stop:2894 length:429 start_codon:yes stop_codon:yes gene_type:complete